MKGLRKQIIALAMVAALAMTALTGCAGVQDSDIVATVGDSKITAGIANLYIRMQQPSYEDYYESYQNYIQQMTYGSVIQETVIDWNMEQDGVTLEESFKDGVMESLQNIYLYEDHMADYEVELTEDELKAIDETVETFLAANSDEVKEKISADKEKATELLKLMTIASKVDEAIKAKVDKEVPDEDAAQKRIRYVSFATTKTDENSQTVEMSEKEIKAVKKEAKAFLKGVKANGNMEAYATAEKVTSTTATYGADYKDDTTLTLPTEVYKEAEKLEVNGFSKLIETDSAFYVVQLESLMDEEATTEEKENIIAERESEAIAEAVESWRKDAKIKVYDKVWKKIKMHDLDVTEKVVEETEDTTEE